MLLYIDLMTEVISEIEMSVPNLVFWSSDNLGIVRFQIHFVRAQAHYYLLMHKDRSKIKKKALFMS